VTSVVTEQRQRERGTIPDVPVWVQERQVLGRSFYSHAMAESRPDISL